MRITISFASAISVGLLNAQLAHAWGAMAHEAVALVAQNYLTSTGSTWVSNLLGSGVTMASVATWADTYRSTTAGSFSSGFHYVDAQDTPPSSCGVNLSRDCGATGCILTAISNYTTRVQNTALPASERTDALKFLIHFFGDITQPLHCEALDVGGNSISVLYSGTKTNLHAVWDSSIPQQLAGGSTLAVATSWSKTLISAIDSGTYTSVKSSWVSCNNVNTASTCALSWAQDTNGYVCSYVLKDGLSAVQNQELSGSYYTGAAPIAALQVAKGGYRLASWLNALAAAA